MRYDGAYTVKDREGKNTMQANVMYPEINKIDGDLYIFPSSQDRYDTLATKYYQDPALWYVIALANIDINPNPASMYPPKGSRIRIPADWQTYTANLELRISNSIVLRRINKNRILQTGFTQIKLY